MRKVWRLAVWVVVTLLIALLATTRSVAEEAVARRTPIVRAVAKAQPAILTLKVTKPASFGRAVEVHGSAVIVAERGYAVTNHHVVTQATTIEAFLADGTRLSVCAIEQLPDCDLAILQLPAGPSYPTLALGPSSDLMVGEEVIAIGNPFGYSHTVSRGIVSAIQRDLQLPASATRLTGLIQTDASINPGSSGGALVNVNGELIGLNVAVRDGAQGIAFAIPSDTIKSVLARRLSAKRISGVDHGLRVAERVVGETGERQRVVLQEANGQVAPAAALQAGTEITKIGGKLVSNAFDVERAFWNCKPGASVALTVKAADGQLREAVLVLPKTTDHGAIK